MCLIICRLRQALRGNEVDTSQYFAAFAKAIPHETFDNPQNLQRIVMQARMESHLA